MQSVVILGRQPALGLAELESIYGAAPLSIFGDQSALLDMPTHEVDFDRLGGSMKLATVLLRLQTTEWRKIENSLFKLVPGLAENLPDGKIQLGISAYGFRVTTDQLLATGLTIKKSFKKSGRSSVRLAPNKELMLSSASVIHNDLTQDLGFEFLIITDGTRTIIARTTAVQDINRYALRDQGRPKRDARVGMLPPKLAQMIVNLAVAEIAPSKDFSILDPFCGTGVVLQEALLMGFSADGSDIEQRMGDYTIVNLDWLQNEFPRTADVPRSWQLGDATNHLWQSSRFIKKDDEVIDAARIPLAIRCVASETYLGKPFTILPPPEILNQTITDCNTIIKKFLRNIGAQITAGTRLCLAVPAWQLRQGQFKHLPLLDSLGELGYNRISFEHVRNEDLTYYREDQVVARQLLIITKS